MNARSTGTGITASAVVAELRKGLRAHCIRPHDVIGTFAGGGTPTVDVTGMSLGEAAVLALVLNESAPPLESRMTLRVGKIQPDGARKFGPERTVQGSAGSSPVPVPENPCDFPPCKCPRCRPELPEEATVARTLRALSGFPSVESMADLWPRRPQ